MSEHCPGCYREDGPDPGCPGCGHEEVIANLRNALEVADVANVYHNEEIARLAENATKRLACGHPAACMDVGQDRESPPETYGCAWCAEVAELEAEIDRHLANLIESVPTVEHHRVCDELARLRDELGMEKRNDRNAMNLLEKTNDMNECAIKSLRAKVEAAEEMAKQLRIHPTLWGNVSIKRFEEAGKP